LSFFTRRPRERPQSRRATSNTMPAINLRPRPDRLPSSIPLPSHRHATPSGPWPWMDLESEETNFPPNISPCIHENCEICPRWLGYPQSHFPNWTPDQVVRCKIASAITDRQHSCKIYHVDVTNVQGKFAPCTQEGLAVTKPTERDLWEWLQISVSGRLLSLVTSLLSDLSRGRLACVSALCSSRICRVQSCKFSEHGELRLVFKVPPLV
jgi:hypothetical protein